jgi:multidrug resistance efflux pump
VTRKRIAVLVGVALAPLLVGAALALFDVWRSASYFVTTRDAHVAARILSAPAPTAGQVGQHFVRVGDVVEEGAIVAWVSGPARLRMNVRAPLAGTVLDLPADEGAPIGAGQPVVTIGDLDHLWVVANVEESRAGLLRPGQQAEVRVEAAGLTLGGVVQAITPATQSALAAPAQQGQSGGQNRTANAATRPPQTIAVRIALALPESGAADLPPLYPGMTAEVKIDVR